MKNKKIKEFYSFSENINFEIIPETQDIFNEWKSKQQNMQNVQLKKLSDDKERWSYLFHQTNDGLEVTIIDNMIKGDNKLTVIQ